ncbi:MAG: hypothetical protein ACKPH7_34340, partial [Planktothrix sp.]|uniref:hypothetical protein n=1 Tax=Planktothrix sp. TaxID=3088171 RepID=UPI0038D4B64D
TDGTPKGTQLVKELGNVDYLNLTNFKDKIYFPINQENKNQLWKTDGTPKGTQQLKNFGAFQLANFYPGSDPDILYFTTVKDDGNYQTPNPEQLWKTDGTPKGTQQLKNFGEFQLENLYSWLDPDTLYFTTVKDDGNYATPDPKQLWKTDGTPKGTQLVKELGNVDYLNLTNFKDKIYFPINQENKNQLWKTDGT